MAYPERKPIYEAYEKIVTEIINNKKFKEYASSEIKAIDSDIIRAFNSIAQRLLHQKFGNKIGDEI